MLVVVVRSLVSNWTTTRHFSKLLAQNSNIGLKLGELALFPGSVQICVLYLHAIKLTNLTFMGNTINNRSIRSAVYGFCVHRMISTMRTNTSNSDEIWNLNETCISACYRVIPVNRSVCSLLKWFNLSPWPLSIPQEFISWPIGRALFWPGWS